MDDGQFRQLLDDLGYAFEGYRRVRKGVKKRLRRHMRRGVPAQRRRLMVLSGFACAFAMVGVAAAVLSALL